MKILILSILIVTTIVTFADDEREHKDRYKKEHKTLTKIFNMELQPLYKKECGSCHMAYQPEFLPSRSWKKMMRQKSLEDHFGVDATLDEEDRVKIVKYLVTNAGDNKRVYGEFREFIESIKETSTPLRISQTPYFKKEHRKIDKRLIEQKEVKTIANCIACHKGAEKGNYDEDSLIIPNYGKWDE